MGKATQFKTTGGGCPFSEDTPINWLNHFLITVDENGTVNEETSRKAYLLFNVSALVAIEVIQLNQLYNLKLY